MNANSLDTLTVENTTYKFVDDNIYKEHVDLINNTKYVEIPKYIVDKLFQYDNICKMLNDSNCFEELNKRLSKPLEISF